MGIMPKKGNGLAKISKTKDSTRHISKKKAPLNWAQVSENSLNNPVPSTSTGNQFQILSDMEGDDEYDLPTITRNATARKNKIPPIIITQKGFNTSLLNSIKVASMTFKYISIGVKISFSEMDCYDQCIALLKNQKIEFFTHRLKNPNFKAVLAGLPNTDPELIREELSSKYNLKAIDIRELKSSYYNENNKLYLISFEGGEVNLQLLRQVRAITQVIVKWLRYSPKFKGPSQCRRCQMFGHGQENCFRNIMCMVCASKEHMTDNCIFNHTANNLVIFKCGNCHAKGLPSNHKANDISCPCRSDYQLIRNRNKSATSRQAPRENTNFSTIRAIDFPSLQSKRRQSEQIMYTPNRTPGVSMSYSDATKQKLLSIDEFFNIFEDALEKFYACKTTADQFKLIVSFMRRAANHNG